MSLAGRDELVAEGGECSHCHRVLRLRRAWRASGAQCHAGHDPGYDHASGVTGRGWGTCRASQQGWQRTRARKALQLLQEEQVVGGETPRPAPSLCPGNCQGPSTGVTLLSGQLPAARVCCQGQPITRNCLWGQVSVPKGNPSLLLFNSRLVVGPRQPPIPLLPSPLFPQPYASVPTTGTGSATPSTRPCGERLPCPGSFSHPS